MSATGAAAPPSGAAPGPSARPPARRRLVGIDTARGLAVLGMFVAHLGLERSTELVSTTGWFWIADGRSSALFATLAGVGLAFMTARAYATGDVGEYRVQRGRILKRAGVLLVLGWALVLLDTPVAVILGAYAALFVLAIPFLRLRPAALLGIAGGLVLVMPTFVLVTRTALLGSPDQPFDGDANIAIIVPGLSELWAGYYPALSWLTYVLVGLAIGRLGLARARTQALLLTAGAGLAAVGYGAGIVLEDTVGPAVRPYVTIAPHTDTTLEIVGNVGVALTVTGLCLLLTTRLTAVRVLLTPISATGAMSLTVYSLQIVYIRVLGDEAVRNPQSNLPLIGLVLVTLVVATLWQLTLGRGPFERALAAIIRPRAGTAGGPPGPPGPPIQHPATRAAPAPTSAPPPAPAPQVRQHPYPPSPPPG